MRAGPGGSSSAAPALPGPALPGPALPGRRGPSAPLDGAAVPCPGRPRVVAAVAIKPNFLGER